MSLWGDCEDPGDPDRSRGSEPASGRNVGGGNLLWRGQPRAPSARLAKAGPPTGLHQTRRGQRVESTHGRGSAPPMSLAKTSHVWLLAGRIVAPTTARRVARGAGSIRRATTTTAAATLTATAFAVTHDSLPSRRWPRSSKKRTLRPRQRQRNNAGTPAKNRATGPTAK